MAMNIKSPVDPIVAAYESRLPERALDDLVDRIMDGEIYPRNGNDPTCLLAVMDEADMSDFHKTWILFMHDSDSLCYELKISLLGIVQDYLRDTVWHVQRTAELRIEDRENAEEVEESSHHD